MANINDVFDAAGSSLFGKNQRPDAPEGNPWPHTFQADPIYRDDGSRDAGFLPIPNYSEFLNVPFKSRGSKLTGFEPIPEYSEFFDKTGDTSRSILKENVISSGKDYGRPQSSGFTPVQYYRTVSSEWSEVYPEYRVVITDDSTELRTTLEAQIQNRKDYKSIGDDRLLNFRHSLDDASNFQNSTDFTSSDGSVESNARYDQFDTGEYISRYDNEDPVFFGFEIELNTKTSPLLNGTVEEFLNNTNTNVKGSDTVFDKYSELTGKVPIIKEFKKELSRYFKLSTDYDAKDSDGQFIFETDTLNDKKFYINRLKGLHNLNERNLGDATKQFVDYRKEKIGVTFYEDTSLNLGTLYSLYKQLYWSRLNGKSIIPENILRFDCKIIVSELRNLTAVKKALANKGVDVLKANVSRYVYYIYECQFFFDKPTHEDDVNIGDAVKSTPKYDISFDFKYSNMVFERFNPSTERYAHIANDRYNPTGESSDNGGRSIPSALFSKTVANNDILKSIIANGELDNTFISDTGIGAMVSDDKSKLMAIYGAPIGGVPLVTNSTNLGGVNSGSAHQQYLDTIVDNSAKNSNGSDTRSAGQKLLESLKKAALNETQRRLNSQFSLINDTLNKTRDQFGITARMSAPRNVYDQNYQENQFFFDVRNSLRGFAGDSLGGMMGI